MEIPAIRRFASNVVGLDGKIAGPGRHRHGSQGRVVNAVWAVILLATAAMTGFNFMVHYLTDLRAPLVIHSITLLTPVAVAGGAVEYSAEYSKRPECTPPQGEGEIHYRFASIDAPNQGLKGAVIVDNVDGIRRAAWPAGERLHGVGAANVPIDLRPGRYSVTATAVYACARATHLLRVETPSMLVDILAR